MEFEKVIGLEIHMRIKSQSKMFCSCKNALELASEPNVNVCPICMWFPGMLPVLNEQVVKLWLLWGMLMWCEVNKHSRFDRKSYFYPDSPISFQITQLYEPIVWAWSVQALVDGEMRDFAIHHMHLENDAGKLSHAGGKTLCDFNRAGSPLMEIVTDPVFHEKEEVMEFLKELQKMMRAGWVSDADMEKGQMRCDVNMSIRPKGSTELFNRTEHKNVNSFSAIGRCIDAEFKRQKKIVESGWEVDQETRGWNDDTGMSKSQRSKEDAMDYRYFPEPDLLPIDLDDDFIQSCRDSMVELAQVIKLVNADELSSTNSKQVIEELYNNGWKADIIVDENNLRQKNDLWALEAIVDEVIAEFASQVEDYKSGNENIFWFFVGQCMKKSRGQWNPKVFNQMLKKKLG